MLAHRLTSRRGAWVTLVLGLLAATVVLGALSAEESPARTDRAPASSESARVAAVLATLPDHDVQPVLLVASRADGRALTPADLEAVTALGAGLSTPHGHRPTPAIRSEDGRAAIVQVPVRVAESSTDTAETITDLRRQLAGSVPPGIEVLVTGGPAFGADIAKAFDGADVTLLLVTVGIVALLLLLTYRSPVLWLVPLAVVGVADQVAAVVSEAVGRTLDLQFDAGIVSVLVFGAGTNYALLLISRYREELHRVEDHREAVAEAWRTTAQAIIASNLTVVLALGSLVLASIPATRGLGIASAAAMLVTLIVVLTLLPAALAVCGHGVFWPFVPRPGTAPDVRHGVFGRVAAGVMRRPAQVAAVGAALLVVLGFGLVGTQLGLDQTERFRTASESAAGLERLGAHFPPGMAQPLLVVTDPAHAGAVARAADAVSGVRPRDEGGRDWRRAGGESGTPTAPAVVALVTDASPGTAEARQLVAEVRSAVHAVPGADAIVGGAEATEADARTGNAADLQLVVPLVLAISAVVLLVLLRSIVAPLLLLPLNALSALAAIGAGSWVGRHLLGWPALDLQVPLIAFLFLVALGIDYTIFLVHRARAEATQHGTRDGMVRAVGATGTVITSAGVVLAAVFAALGVLPLVTLGQLGLIVGLGVLLDTVVVRTLLVPALAGLVGDRLWWPAPPTNRVK
jgi:RND superfamily putative drug exporter